jgi:uncharacterized coiled-coil DUF342 family protein
MGKLTNEKIAAIVKRYNELLSYTEVGKEFGVKWITVKRHVKADMQQKTAKDPSTDSAEVQSTTSVKKGKSNFAQAIKLFSEGKNMQDIVIELDIPHEEVRKYWENFCEMTWIGDARKFFALHDHEQVNIMQLFVYMRNQGMDAESYALRLKKNFNDLDEVTKKTNQLSVKTRELTEEIDLKHEEIERKTEELDAIEDQINSKRERLQELQDTSQEIIGQIENDKKEAEDAERTIGDLDSQKQQISSEVKIVKHELDELLDPNGPKAAALKNLVKNEVVRVLDKNDMMRSISLVAVISAIQNDKFTLEVLNTMPSGTSPQDVIRLGRHLAPYLERVYNEQAQYFRTRFVDVVVAYQHDEIRRISKDPQYRVVRQQDLAANYPPPQPDDHVQWEQQQDEGKMFLDFVYHETIGKYMTGVRHNEYKKQS